MISGVDGVGREWCRSPAWGARFLVVRAVEGYEGTLERFEGTQEYKEPSSCLGPFGDRAWTRWRAGWRYGRKWWSTKQSAVGVSRGLKVRRKGWNKGYDQRVSWLLDQGGTGGRSSTTRSTRKLQTPMGLICEVHTVAILRTVFPGRGGAKLAG